MSQTITLRVEDDEAYRKIVDAFTGVAGVEIVDRKGPATKAQLQLIGILCSDRGWNDPERYEQTGLIVGRQIRSTKQLTVSEASHVIEVLKGEK